MRHPTLSLLTAVGLAVSLTSCFGARSIERRYYLLHPAMRDIPDAKERLPGVLYVRDLEIDRVYDKFKLVIRKSPYVLLYSGSHSWAVRPNRMVSDILAETLMDANLFSSVTRQLAAGRPDYELGGTIRAIEAQTGSEPWRARISLDLQLVRFDDGKVLWRHEIDAGEPMGDDLDDVPRAISELLDRALREAMADLMAGSERIRQQLPAVGDRDRAPRGFEQEDHPERALEEEPPN